ncbi:hypothetical protein DFH27DRAFT_11760 [Peziza echinospora]|nr:hypothetical protein DFH27DRAFT_11760 [Peziza echinospora]
MEESTASISVAQDSSLIDGDASAAATTTPSSKLDLSQLPPTHLLPTHLSDTKVHDLEQLLQSCSAPLTYDINEARIFLADINTPRRCILELKSRGLHTQQVQDLSNDRNIVNDSCIRIVKLKWLTESLSYGKPLPFDQFLIYAGHRIQPAPTDARTPIPLSSSTPVSSTSAQKRKGHGGDSSGNSSEAEKRRRGILERAKRDAEKMEPKKDFHKRRGYRDNGGLATLSRQAPPPLERKTTAEWEDEHKLLESRVMPEYVTKNLRYACQRPHPLNSPNSHFVSLLHTIKLSRELSLDQIGIRAYSTAISAIQAYPYALISSAELAQLPGCDGKASALFHEYIHSTPTPASKPDDNRRIKVVTDLEKDEEFQILKTFHAIWGVGAKTARGFYFEKGWRSLDDVVEFGWNKLSRVQQIGVKYYDELETKIVRDEVERIGRIIGEAANVLRPGTEYIICGGYRRGKTESGDVDVILSNRDGESIKDDFISLVLEKLENDGWVTHTLHLGNAIHAHSKIGSHHRAGFDGLEKAMVVWQEQELQFEGKDLDMFPKNPHPHRRVDIILSPPESIGTAVLGWTGATTYERDLRRYLDDKGLRFGSDGVFERTTGKLVEGLHGWKEGESMADAERRVIEGLGLPYYKPELRNTG